MTTNTTATEAVAAVYFPDFCRECEQRCGCSRFDTITEPDSIKWDGPGASVTASYECPNGHQWTCCWSPEYLPPHPRKER